MTDDKYELVPQDAPETVEAPAQQDVPYAYLCPSCGTRGVETPGQVCGLCLAINSMGRTPPPPPA